MQEMRESRIRELAGVAVDRLGPEATRFATLRACGSLVAVLSMAMEDRCGDDVVVQKLADVWLAMQRMRELYGWETTRGVIEKAAGGLYQDALTSAKATAGPQIIEAEERDELWSLFDTMNLAHGDQGEIAKLDEMQPHARVGMSNDEILRTSGARLNFYGKSASEATSGLMRAVDEEGFDRVSMVVRWSLLQVAKGAKKASLHANMFRGGGFGAVLNEYAAAELQRIEAERVEARRQAETPRCGVEATPERIDELAAKFLGAQ